MTFSEKSERRYPITAGVCGAGFAVAIMSFLLGAMFDAMPGAICPIIAGFLPARATGMWAYSLDFHCPRCGRNLGELYRARTVPGGGGPNHFCPSCGQEFDAIDEDGRLIATSGATQTADRSGPA